MRILFLSHGHPTFSAGGAERAAYSLFRHAQESTAVEKAVFAATVSRELIGHDADFGLFRGKRDEILINLPPVDHFTHQTEDYDRLKLQLTNLLEFAKPDIVHLHHFVTFGVEVVQIIKDYGAKVILTIHEYLLICHNFGQMVKTSGKLCSSRSHLECSGCFPDITPGRFFLREQMLKTYLEGCDFLVSPSFFLRNRFIDWGVSPEAIAAIENPLDPQMLLERGMSAEAKLGEQPGDLRLLKIGYFGQINPFKGLQTLLDAVQLVPKEVRKLLHIGVHGANLEIWTGDFRDKIARSFKLVDDCVHNFGSYDNRAVRELMQGYDRIVVPSLWWENSPVVMQEARLAGTPVLCSRLGGMEEKANGPHDVVFQPGNPMSLATEIVKLAARSDRPRTPRDLLLEEQKISLKSYFELYSSIGSKG